MAASRPFRFSVNVLSRLWRSEWGDMARKAEDLGYDVLQVPDHMGNQSPFPALVTAAESTNLRLGTYVINTGLYVPNMLARLLATTDQLTDGRLEVGLGAGYIPADFHAVGIPFPSGRERAERLMETVRRLRTVFADADFAPPTCQRPAPPLLVAGDGDRVLGFAAQEADIVGFSVDSANRPGADPGQALENRVQLVRDKAGKRFEHLELNLFISTVAVTRNDAPDLRMSRFLAPDLSDEQLLRLPTVLTGTEHQIAETILSYREKYDITYFTILEPHMHDFSRVINLLR
jgi:probable F420-dependent oxidoreductase